MIERATSFEGNNYSGGLVTANSPFELDENQSPDCMNVISDVYKNVGRGLGYQKINADDEQGSGIEAIYDYKYRDGTRFLLGKFGTTLSHMKNLGGTFTSLQTGLPLGPMSFTELNKILIFKGDGKGLAYSWNGVDDPEEIVQLHPKSRGLVQWQQHIFYYREDSPNQLRYSNYNNHTQFPGDNFYYTSDDADIVKLIVLKGKLYLLKEYGIDRVTYLGGLPLLDLRGTVNGIGTSSPDAVAIAHHREFGDVAIFPTSDNRIIMFNGSEFKFVSDPIEKMNNESPFSLGDLSNAVATVDHKRNWYIIWFGSNYGLVYDIDLNSWWPFNNQGFVAAHYVQDPNGFKQVITGKGGFIYRWWQGDKFDTTAIDGYWTSPKIDLGDPDFLKKGYRATVHAKALGNFNLIYSDRIDDEENYSREKTIPLFHKGEYLLGQTTVTEDRGFTDDALMKLGGKRRVRFPIDLRTSFNIYQYKIRQSGLGPGFKVHRTPVHQKPEGIS